MLETTKTKKWQGIGASFGIALAPVYLLVQPSFSITQTKVDHSQNEWNYLEKILQQTSQQLDVVWNLAQKKLGTAKALVFEAHKQIVNDPELKTQLQEYVLEQGYNGAYAINCVYTSTMQMFLQLKDDYFQQRAYDVADVQNRLLANYFQQPLPDLLAINTPVIIVAVDLAPSQTALLDKKYVKGFVTAKGGKTSHSAIMARTLGIPAVVGVSGIDKAVVHNHLLALDGNSGVVEYEPEDKTKWQQALIGFEKNQNLYHKYAHQKAYTKDQKHFHVELNIGHPNDCIELDCTYDGIGLFRSEFLYMDNNTWPSCQQQFEAYKQVLSLHTNQTVVVRTLDIGGDKHLSYYRFPNETNPFLGNRAIRFSFSFPEIFQTQLEALLRASVYGKLAIMFPMIATIAEIQKALATLEQVKQKLQIQNIPYASNIQLGMMVEIPAVVWLIDHFSAYVDFFSIGTNDLIQYSLAVDRLQEQVTYLYQPNDPSILRALDHVVRVAKKHHKTVAMCGEMAADVYSIPLLLGLGQIGLDALSMNATTIGQAKYIIAHINQKDCAALLQAALKCATSKQVNQLVAAFFDQHKLVV